MSKVYLKGERTPIIVPKKSAETLFDGLANPGSIPDATVIQLTHAEGKRVITFGQIRDVDITNDDDFKAKKQEDVRASDSQVKRPSTFESWTSPRIKALRNLSPELKASQLGFPKLVWDLSRKDAFDEPAVKIRLVEFFKQNPERTLPDVYVVLGGEDQRTIMKHNIVERSILNIVFEQIRNDKHFY